jgi:hypothetical protein
MSGNSSGEMPIPVSQICNQIFCSSASKMTFTDPPFGVNLMALSKMLPIDSDQQQWESNNLEDQAQK